MKKLSLFSLFIFVLALSCSEDSNSPNNNSKELMPLKIGNTWVHINTSYFGFRADTSKVSSTVEYEEMYNGEKYFRIEMLYHYNNYKSITPFYYNNKADGLHMLYYINSNQPQTDIFKYPATEGEIIYSDKTIKFYVEKVNITRSTSAGKFKCIKYVRIRQINGYEIDRIETYFCPGVGEIAVEMFQREYESKYQSLFFKSELVSYSLK